MEDDRTRRLRLAVFSPLPPVKSGIAEYNLNLLPFLEERADATFFVQDPEEVSEHLGPGIAVDSIQRFRQRRWSFDMPIYHMGNNYYHARIYQAALRYPGILVLHDPVLHHYLHWQSGQDRDWAAYKRDMAYAGGPAAAKSARRISQGKEKAPYEQVPLNRRLVERNLATVVHSSFARAALMDDGVQSRICHIPLAYSPQSGQSIRSELGWDDGRIVFGSFGFVHRLRQVDRALRAFARVLSEIPSAQFLLVGDIDPALRIEALISELGIADRVHSLPFVADSGRFLDLVSTVDVVINLREPTLGETSAATLQAMGAGKPVIVSNHGWYAELPPESCVQVSPGSDDELLASLLRLAADDGARSRISLTASNYVTVAHDPVQVAARYVDLALELLREGDLRPA